MQEGMIHSTIVKNGKKTKNLHELSNKQNNNKQKCTAQQVDPPTAHYCYCSVKNSFLGLSAYKMHKIYQKTIENVYK